MRNNDFYLIEDFNPTIDYTGSKILALTPEACYNLDKAGIKYSVIEDYYKEKDMLGDEDSYFYSQLHWFANLDKYLQSNIGIIQKYSFELARRYYYSLKMAIDPIVIRCYMLEKFINCVKPTRINYIRRETNDENLDFSLSYGNESLYSRLIQKICKKYSIPLSIIPLKKTQINKANSVQYGNHIIKWIKRAVKNSWLLTGIYYLCKSLPFNYLKRITPKPKKLKILILKGGYGIEGLIKDAFRNNCDIFLRHGQDIIKITPFLIRHYYRMNNQLSQYDSLIYEEDWKIAAGNLAHRSEIFEWINSICQLDISDIIAPRLQYFIQRVCPEIIEHARRIANFYDNENIDFVITPHEWFPEDYGMILACMLSKHTKSINIQHGNSIFALKWGITELEHFDYYFASDNEIAQYFQRDKVSELQYMKDCRCRIFQGSYRLKKIEDLSHRRNMRRGRRNLKETVFYLPTMLFWDTRYLNAPFYPDTWYYEFQKKLIEFFATKKDFIFVWKGLPVADAIWNPIPNFIRDKNFDNIEISTIPFQNHLLWVDRLIIDFPSTGLYEAIIAGIPTLALYYETCKVRSSVSDIFGAILQKFSSDKEAIEKIDNFLYSDPNNFVTEMPIPENNIFDTLLRLKD